MALTIDDAKAPYFVRGKRRTRHLEDPVTRQKNRQERSDWLARGRVGHAPRCNRLSGDLITMAGNGNVSSICPGCRGIFC